MAIWLIRGGKHGEYEQKFINEKRVYVTWSGLAYNLVKMKDRAELLAKVQAVYQDAKPKQLLNYVSQVWPFARDIKKGDLVVMPLKLQRTINIGEVTSEYHFEPTGPNPFYHWRSVKWIGENIPRTHFGQDLLNSFGAFMTICRIQRNNADARISSMHSNGWKPESTVTVLTGSSASNNKEAETDDVDLEEQARDQIAKLINAKFKNHGLARLVDAILRAQGYTTYLSPEGPDGGIDILAGANALGFGSPRICVQVKSQDSPVGRPEVEQLAGAMENTKADAALFVAWGGFKSTVYKALATRFFRIRLWSQKDLLEQLFATYDKLDEDLKAELPLKHIWTVAAQED